MTDKHRRVLRFQTPFSIRHVTCTGNRAANTALSTCGTPGFTPFGFRLAPFRLPPHVRNTNAFCRMT
jgi:hypothetical protein